MSRDIEGLNYVQEEPHEYEQLYPMTWYTFCCIPVQKPRIHHRRSLRRRTNAVLHHPLDSFVSESTRPLTSKCMRRC